MASEERCERSMAEDLARRTKAGVQDSSCAPTRINVVYHKVSGETGETVLDATVAELLFVARWRRTRMELCFDPMNYPTVSALGPLPAGCGRAVGGIATRASILGKLKAVDHEYYGRAHSPEDAAFCGLLQHRVATAIAAVLYLDCGVWEDVTRPALVRSAPLGFGGLVAWNERQRQRRMLDVLGGRSFSWAAAMLDLQNALTAISDRLAARDSFGIGGEITQLDACAYGHLAVLYSIPCDADSALHKVLMNFPTLIHFCDRMEMRLGAWPDPRSFLVSVQDKDRLPGAIAAGEARLLDGTAPHTSPRRSDASLASYMAALRGDGANAPYAALWRLRWWELWGWSWNTRRRPAESGARRIEPPSWYVPIFGMACCMLALQGLAMGLGPPSLHKGLRLGGNAEFSSAVK